MRIYFIFLEILFKFYINLYCYITYDKIFYYIYLKTKNIYILLINKIKKVCII